MQIFYVFQISNNLTFLKLEINVHSFGLKNKKTKNYSLCSLELAIVHHGFESWLYQHLAGRTVMCGCTQHQQAFS